MQSSLSFYMFLFFCLLKAFLADEAAVVHDICSRNVDKSVKFDVIFSGKISEFFGQTSGLIEVKKIYRGDKRYENNFVIVEGFKNCAAVLNLTNLKYFTRTENQICYKFTGNLALQFDNFLMPQAEI